MSMPLIECVVSRISHATGKAKSEKYLIDALSFTEAEIRLREQMDIITRNEFFALIDDDERTDPKIEVPKANYEPKSLKVVKIEQVLSGDFDGDYWFEFKVGYEPDGSGKKFTVLAQANDLESALREAKDYLSTWACTCYISKIAIATVLDLFKYSGPMRENDPNRQMGIDFSAKPKESSFPKEELKEGDHVLIFEGAHFGKRGVIDDFYGLDSLKAAVILSEEGSPEVEVWTTDMKLIDEEETVRSEVLSTGKTEVRVKVTGPITRKKREKVV
jgi:hypothetical protein